MNIAFSTRSNSGEHTKKIATRGSNKDWSLFIFSRSQYFTSLLLVARIAMDLLGNLAAILNCSALWGIQGAKKERPREFVCDSVNFLVRQSKNMIFLWDSMRSVRRPTRNSKKLTYKASMSCTSFGPWTPHNALQFKMASPQEQAGVNLANSAANKRI